MYLTSNTNYGTIYDGCMCFQNLVWLGPPSLRNGAHWSLPKIYVGKMCWISQLVRRPHTKSISEIESYAVLETMTCIFCLSLPKLYKGWESELDVTYFYSFGFLGFPLNLCNSGSYNLHIWCANWLQGVLPEMQNKGTKGAWPRSRDLLLHFGTRLYFWNGWC